MPLAVKHCNIHTLAKATLQTESRRIYSINNDSMNCDEGM